MQRNNQEKSPIKSRILQYLEIKGISRYAFYKDSGIARGILDQDTGISEENILRFLDYARDISPSWILTGEGNMLVSPPLFTENILQTKTTENLTLSIGKEKGKEKGKERKLRETLPFEEESLQTKTTENVINSIDNIIDNKRKLRKTSPIIPPPAVASNVTVTYDSVAEDAMHTSRHISTSARKEQMIPLYEASMFLDLSKLFTEGYPRIGYISLPNLSECDGATLMPGDSMEPEIKRGDIIVYQKVSNKYAGLCWGQIYLLSCDMGDKVYVTVRYVLQSENEGHVQLVSANKNYQPLDVPLEAIKELAMVKASIRYTAMI